MVAWLSMTSECTQILRALLHCVLFICLVVIKLESFKRHCHQSGATRLRKMNVYIKIAQTPLLRRVTCELRWYYFQGERFASSRSAKYYNCRSHFFRCVDIFIEADVSWAAWFYFQKSCCLSFYRNTAVPFSVFSRKKPSVYQSLKYN